eukprot:g6570.t1
MSSFENSDLMSIGRHCAVPSCGQVDFLPFRCDCCHKTFCLEHRTYESHNCQKCGTKQTETIVCPLCARGIRLTPGQDPNVAFEAHQRTGCDTRNYARVHKKPICPVEGCKVKLNSVNKIECKECGITVCLQHRLPTDHNCAAIRAKQKMAAKNSWNLFPTKRPTTHVSKSTPSTSRTPRPQPQPHLNCQQCGARFSRNEELRSHLETFHGPTVFSNQGTYGGCPYCGRTFHDAVELVDHVENKCSQNKPTRCAIS